MKRGDRRQIPRHEAAHDRIILARAIPKCIPGGLDLFIRSDIDPVYDKGEISPSEKSVLLTLHEFVFRRRPRVPALEEAPHGKARLRGDVGKHVEVQGPRCLEALCGALGLTLCVDAEKIR